MAQSQLEAANGALFKLGARTVLTAVSTSGTTQEERSCANRIEICKRAVLRMHPWNYATKRKKITPYQNVAVSNVTWVSSNLIEVTHAATTYVAGNYVTLVGIEGAIEANGVWEIPSSGIISTTVTRLTTTDMTLAADLSTYSASATDYIRRSPAFGFSYLYALPSGCQRVLKINDSVASPSWVVEGGFILSNDSELEIKYIDDVTDYTLMDTLAYECLAIYLAWDLALELGRDMTVKDRLWEDLKAALSKARFADATEDSMQALQASDWTGSRLNAQGGLGTSWV